MLIQITSSLNGCWDFQNDASSVLLLFYLPLKGSADVFRLGIDLGGTNIVAGIIDENLQIITKSKRKTNAERPIDEIIADIAETASDVIQKAGLDINDIVAAGIGLPGSVDAEKGVLLNANNLGKSGCLNVPIIQKLKKHINLDFFIENDANAAAYGEFVAGAGKDAKNFIMITLGTGVGGGIIIDGKLYSGSNYAGGEVGHSVIYADGEMCSCGRRGCWEAYASVTALIQQTKTEMLKHCDNKMWEICGGDISKVDGTTAFVAMKKGDALGEKIVKKYINYISIGIVNIINIFQPDIICIGGGISNEGDTLLLPIIDHVNKEDYARNDDKRVGIKIASLNNDAGIIGAACLCDLYDV